MNTNVNTERAILTFDARHLARAWLSVAVASSKDKDRPTLDRTVAVEFFDTGVRLVATDSYILLHSWVPVLPVFGKEPLPASELDEAPLAAVVATDHDGRGKGLFAYALGVAEAEDAPIIEMRLSVEVVEDPHAFPGMASECVAIEMADQERVCLAVHETPFPNWRTFISAFRGQKTDRVALHPDRLAQVAKLAKVQPACPVLWRFGGVEKPASIEVAQGNPMVLGIVMPSRVEWDSADEPVTGETIATIAQEVARRINDGALGPDVTATASAAVG